MAGNKSYKSAYPIKKAMRKGTKMAEITLEELNRLADFPEKTIEESEKEYHDKIFSLASRIISDDKIKLVLLAGPSGSGKTTTANLIADALRSQGEEAMVVSLDNYYLDSDDGNYPRLENGELDYECPEALDLRLLEKSLSNITKGLPFTVPKYEFKSGKRVSSQEYTVSSHSCVIIEGLHALNPKIHQNLDKSKLLKLFVSVSTNVNEGDERILSGRKARFVRRLVRDSIYRGANAERTLTFWQAVLAAEDIYLYPYKEDADLSFNTFHSFELSVMKPFAEKLISKSLAEGNAYAKTVICALNKIKAIDYALVPENSLIREFIPGGIYESLY